MPRIELGGYPVLAVGTVLWSATTGVQPNIQAFDVDRFSAGFIVDDGTVDLSKRDPIIKQVIPGITDGISLKYTSDLGEVSEWKNLFVIHNEAAPDPNYVRVVVADRRYWWPYTYVYRFFNKRRRVGTLRRGMFQEALQQGVVTEFGQYARYSRNAAGRSWEPREALISVIEEVNGIKPKIRNESTYNAVPLEDVDIDHPGDAAIGVLMQSIPGAEITLDSDGNVVVFGWASREERTILGLGGLPGEGEGETGPRVVNAGNYEFIRKDNIRPVAIDVLFQIEAEVRFDFLGDDASRVDRPDSAGSASSVALEDSGTPRELQNVMPLPDFELKMEGVTEYQNTFFPITDIVKAWQVQLSEQKPPIQGIVTLINLPLIRRAFVPHRPIWTELGIAGVEDAFGTDAQWGVRIAGLQEHYRQTYRIPKDWTDRTLAMRPYLVATIDTVSAQRAPAMVFSNHCIVHGRKQLLRDKYGKVSDGMNVRGYPGKDVPLNLDLEGSLAAGTTKTITWPAPARLSILDEDQGIIKLNYLTDPWGNTKKILPSLVDNPPQRNRAKWSRTTPVHWNSIVSGGDEPQLATEHGAAVLFTMIPATTLYRVRVKLDDVKDLVKAAAGGLPSARGPIREVRCPAAVETARIQWRADAKLAIEKAFRVGVNSANIDDVTDDLRPYCINDGRQVATGSGAASLWDIARSIASAYYLQGIDRIEGNKTGVLAADADKIIPAGAMSNVSFTVGPDGSLLTSYSLRGDLPLLDFRNLLDPGTFRVVARRVF